MVDNLCYLALGKLLKNVYLLRVSVLLGKHEVDVQA